MPYDLDVSPDGKRVSASFGEISGRQSVRIFDVDKLLAGDTTPVQEFDFGGSTVPSNFTFSPDGQYLYGSSYFTGVSNIFRYNIATKETDALTNAETGFFRPIPLEGDELLVFRYSGQGFVPTRITAKKLEDLSAITFLGQKVIEEHPELAEVDGRLARRCALRDDAEADGHLRLAGGLQLESLIRSSRATRTPRPVGLRVNFSDPLQLNRLSLSASYSPRRDSQSRRARPPAGRVPAVRLAGRGPSSTTPISTTCSGRRRRGGRATSSASATSESLLWDEPTRSASSSTAATPASSTRCRPTRTSRSG